jgi:hypothetical protein
MFANSPLGPRIAEARRQDDFARVAAYRKTAQRKQGDGVALNAPTAPAAITTTMSIRYRIGATMVSLGRRISGVELRPHSLDDAPSPALPGVR